MAKLTRMQKYADVRDQMAHDREATNRTNELDEYENKLKTLQGFAREESTFDSAPQELEEGIPTFNFLEKEIDIKDEILETEKESDSFLDFLSSLDTDNINKAVEVTINTPIDKIKGFEFKELDLDDIKEETKDDVFAKEETFIAEFEKEIEAINVPKDKEEPKEIEPLLVEPILDEKEETVVDEVKVELDEVKEDVKENNEEIKTVEEVVETPVAPVEEEIETEKEEVVDIVKEEEPLLVEPILDEKEETVVDEVKVELDEVKEDVKENNEEINNEIKSVEEEVVEAPVAPVEEEIEAKKEDESIAELEDVNVNINNDYVNKTLEEVEDYVKKDGKKTIDDISRTMIDNIRHPENNQVKPVIERKEEVETSISDEEFSNTVTLEIDKVLSEIKKEATSKAPEIKIEKTAAKDEVKPDEFAQKLANTFEHPVLVKNNQDEPIEIKTLDETLRQEAIKDTIKFNVDDMDDSDDYEDDAPNKVLNVILVILIIILIAILGVIVYYILFAKEII